MSKTAVRWMGYSLVVVIAALFTGCTDEVPLGPDGRFQSPGQLAVTKSDAAALGRAVDLGTCENLQPPAGSKLVFHAYAKGVQIYHWSGSEWSFDGPSANLFADARGRSKVGTHYAGPTWESASGGKVVGAVVDRCTPDANAVPWLRLSAVSEGPGIFHRVTTILRVNTVGGKAPSNAGAFTGEEARVPYTTEYLFYREQ